MAVLYRLISVGGESAGFMLPIFRSVAKSNHELIQSISSNDRVVAFEPVLINDDEGEYAPATAQIEIGDQAIWAFRDNSGDIHVGTSGEIKDIGRRLLSSGALKQNPMAAAEVAAFCEVEEQHSDVLLEAFKLLKGLSSAGAATWRDSVILLPHIKRDIKHQLSPSLLNKISLDDIFAVTKGDVTHVYTSEFITDAIPKLPRWQKLAAIFGIYNFKVHPIGSVKKEKVGQRPNWFLYGYGGIARFVIERSPFFGKRLSQDGAIAVGPLSRTDRPNIVIAVMPSDARFTRRVNDVGQGLASKNGTEVKHAINVRPIGFGTPQKSKLAPNQILNLLEDFEFVWLIANHRKCLKSVSATGISASSEASRFVRAASLGLITCLESPEGRSILLEARATPSFGLVGAAKPRGSKSVKEVVQRVVYSMLCEDAQLHTARRIVILWPYTYEKGSREIVEFGAHRYVVDMIPHPSKSRFQDIIGLAFNVKLSRRTKEEFFDFCYSLIAGYGWELARKEESYLILENERDSLRLWPVTSMASSMRVTADKRFDPSVDIIVTNQTIPAHYRKKVWDKRAIFHYSELDMLMRNSYETYGFMSV